MDDCKEIDILNLATTVGSREDAQRIACAAVQGRLAACVQIEPIESVYIWEGRLCQQPEYRLSFKTVVSGQAKLEHWLGQQHPYELPQIVATRCVAARAYGDWVQAQVAIGATGLCE